MTFDDLLIAFMWRTAEPMSNRVVISRSTGQIFWSNEEDMDEFPEDVEINPDYVELPDQYQLDLGKELVWMFVRREIPGLEHEVRDMFSRKGGYGRFKAFLARHGLLEAWQRFETAKTEETLRDWCREVGLTIEGSP